MALVYNSQLDAFELYHRIQERQEHGPFSNFLSPDGSALPALGHAIAGSIGSAISNVCTYPLDLIITRLQIRRQLQLDRDPKKTSTAAAKEARRDEADNIQDEAWRIYETEGGIWAFYAGLLPDTGKTVMDSFLFFLAYNFLRRRRIVARGGDGKSGATAMLPVLDELGVGFIAGSLTKLLTTPISNIVTRKQISTLPSSDRRQASSNDTGSFSRSSSTRQIVRDILQQKGILGFWSGYSAALVLTLNPSLTSFLFESLKRLVLPRSRRANPPPSATFVLAAISKACASSVTYPFSVAKARAQVSSNAKLTPSTPRDASMQSKSADSKGADSAAPPSSSSSIPSPSYLSSRVIAALKATIFSTILDVFQTDGLRALYSGLSLELSKSFLSHGITMVVKQYVHRLIIRAYYILGLISAHLRSKGLRSSGLQMEKLMVRAREQRHEYFDLARSRACERAQQAKAKANDAVTDALGAAVGGDLTDKAHRGVADLVADYVDDEETSEDGSKLGKSLYGATGRARWLEDR